MEVVGWRCQSGGGRVEMSEWMCVRVEVCEGEGGGWRYLAA